jgi:hypothetical protein
MRHPKGTPTHSLAPAEYRRVPDITGSFELDQVIRANPNKDMSSRLKYHLSNQGSAYGPLTAYSGYHNYHGDS